MMYHEKADVIQECIDRLQDYGRSKYLGVSLNDMGVAMGCIETLMKLKTEVDALAEQEMEARAEEEKKNREEHVNEDREIKQGVYLDNEIARGNIHNSDEVIRVGVSEDCYYETTPAEMQRDDYRRP